MGACIWMAVSLCCSPETFTRLLICYEKWKSLSHVRLFGLRGIYSPWNSTGQNTGVGSLSLLQGIFPTQGLNPGLPHCRWILYQLSPKGSPRILEWVAYLFSSWSSDPGIGLGSLALQSYSLPVELSSSVVPFSSCLQFFPASGSFPMSWLFTSGGQSIGTSASVLPMNIQGWLPLGLTGLISLQSKGFSRVFSNTTVQKNQFFKHSAFF